MSVCKVVPHVTSRNFGRISAALSSAKLNRSYFTYTQSLSQPLDRVPERLTAKEAFEKWLKSGMTIYAQGAAATPVPLLDAMTEVGAAKNLRDIKVVHMHTEKEAKYVAPEYKDIFRKIIKPDIALIQVSPPDQHGYCSLGTSVDCVRAALVNSPIIVAQINVNMPRTFGDAIIHMSHIDTAVEDNTPLPEHGGKPASPEETKIGQLIGQNLVENGATLQMGIGSIPDAVLSALKDHKDLGIHSEMFSVGVIDLVKRGCITNNEKKFHRGRMVGSFLVGNRALYDFVDNNPFVEMLEIDYVNNTHIISLLPKMTAINSCIEVDLTGQVCADSIGTRMFSGFGGQVDFIRGAAESVDGRGKPIIALVSVTKKGESKIVPTLKVGAGVVTSRAHVNYVVTEQGIADLFGKTLRQRAYELIKISHPDHREALEKAAFERLKCMPAP
ncbi:hypothetical protein B5X24_HaOG215570 [Helicoverpa armigera]|nr:hypothetical protein B5X24_HaOG215570 [Helicoverpa armigera]